MADEYICRQEMLDAVEKLNIIPSIDGMGKPTPTEDFRVQFLGTVLHVPSADVVPVVHSQWKRKIGEIQCLKCGNRIHRIDLSGWLNFCPNCGAKMDGGDEHG